MGTLGLTALDNVLEAPAVPPTILVVDPRVPGPRASDELGGTVAQHLGRVRAHVGDDVQIRRATEEDHRGAFDQRLGESNSLSHRRSSPLGGPWWFHRNG